MPSLPSASFPCPRFPRIITECLVVCLSPVRPPRPVAARPLPARIHTLALLHPLCSGSVPDASLCRCSQALSGASRLRFRPPFPLLPSFPSLLSSFPPSLARSPPLTSRCCPCAAMHPRNALLLLLRGSAESARVVGGPALAVRGLRASASACRSVARKAPRPRQPTPTHHSSRAPLLQQPTQPPTPNPPPRRACSTPAQVSLLRLRL